MKGDHILVSIDEATGNIRFLVNEMSAPLLDETSVIKRASHVEPVNVVLRMCFYFIRWVFGESNLIGNFTRQWRCYWRVNLKPVGGPLIPIDWASRKSAIDFEIMWLEKNFL